MYLMKATPPNEAAGICRLVRAEDRQIVFWDRSYQGPDGKLKFEGNWVPCQDKVGRLRMKRTGTILSYWYASGTSGDSFEEIHRCEFGSDDIVRMSVRGLTGKRPCLLDMRFLDLRIRSAQPVTAAVTAVAQAGDHAVKGTWKLWLVLALVMALSLGVLLAVRQRRRPGTMPAPAAGAGSQPVPAAISFPCSECGKTLKARAELAGKKVKCPGCGRPVHVPAAEQGSSATPSA
jgi:hypothetical protein